MKRFLSLGMLLLFGACLRATEPQAGSQTHFLRRCEDSCPAPYTCACGVCTRGCSSDAVCKRELDRAACLAPGAGTDACDATAKLCDVACQQDAECSGVGAGFTCQSGRCRPTASVGTGGKGVNSTGGTSTGGAGTRGNGGSGGTKTIDGGPDAADGGCASGRGPYYDHAGCNGTVAPICAGPDFDACLSEVCGCDGETLSGCGFYQKPWAHTGACADAGGGDGGP